MDLRPPEMQHLPSQH